MSADDTHDPDENGADDIEPADVRAELDRQRSRGSEEFDDALVDFLSRALDTDTRVRLYVHLRQRPYSTTDELAEATGVYPSAVRRVLRDFQTEGVVERRERASQDGDTDSEYTAIPPNELIDVLFDQVQDELKNFFGLDSRDSTRPRSGTEPVTIPVEDADDRDQ